MIRFVGILTRAVSMFIGLYISTKLTSHYNLKCRNYKTTQCATPVPYVFCRCLLSVDKVPVWHIFKVGVQQITNVTNESGD